MDPLDRTDIQSIVMRPYPSPASRHFLFKLEDEAGAKRFLAYLLPQVSHAGIDLAGNPGPFLNVAVSYPGLGRLGALDASGAPSPDTDFPDDFRIPPTDKDIKAYGRSAPGTWWNGRFATADIGLSVHVYGADAAAIDRASTDLRKAAGAGGVEELVPTLDREAITGQVLGDATPNLRKLHFGYSDGFSQPDVNWDADPARAGGTYPRGNFLIDDWDPKAESFPRYEPWRGLVRHGSYLALAWVRQDVAAFNRYLRDNAAQVALPGMGQAEAEEYLAAKMMGRWRDGTPLALSPVKPDAGLATRAFDYAADASGRSCPFAAHIRITNGRDQPLDALNAGAFPAGFPRVLRRGSSYGPPLAGTQDDGVDRGILGMFFCASVRQQFYSLMRWIGATDFSDVYEDHHGQDPLFGNRAVPKASDSFLVPRAGGDILLKGLPDFIRLQGMAILLMPSLTTLRRLAA